MQPDPGSSSFFSKHRWLRVVALYKRTLNEGFGAFALSIALLTIGLCLLRTWWVARIALQVSIQEQILKTVGTAQEPTDANEAGLIAAALATINEKSEDICGGPDTAPYCPILERFHVDLAMSLNGKLKSTAKVRRYPAPPDYSRVEFRDGPLCEAPDADHNSYLLVPVQMATFLDVQRFQEEVAISSALDETLKAYRVDPKNRPLFEELVQVYFISPNSVLRIWSTLEANVCKEFSKTKLWASKNYFTFFWDHPDKKSFTTPAYIDYGGNGLVQTRCEEVDEKPGPEKKSEHERMLGVVCADFKSKQLSKLDNQLFFQTAFVTFPDSYDPTLANVEQNIPSDDRRRQPEQPATSPPRSLAALGGVVAANLPNERKSQGSIAEQNGREDPLVNIEGGNLVREDVQQALKDIKNPGPSLRRDITHVPFRGRTAFLIPLGPPSGSFHALFFFPRSPALRPKALWFQAFGFALVGAAIASAALGSRLRTKAGQLRDKLTILRSMQIAFCQVDSDDWILEANDRAEELFRRQLPKPGVTRAQVNFEHLIQARLVESSTEGCGYVPLTAGEVKEARLRGEASSYYARLIGEDPRWLRISATPMMNLREHGTKSDGVYLGNISATAYEVQPGVARQLDDRLRHNPPQESGD